jgi:hypothetical protein
MNKRLRWLGVLWAVLAALMTAAGTTTANAATFTYDGLTIAAVDAQSTEAVAAGRTLLGDEREWSVPSSVEVRDASRTPILRSVATNTARGGVGPVRRGQAGVDAVAADIEAAGGRVLGREITVEAGGVRTRPDLYVELPCGTRCFVEVKNGPSAGLTPNQRVAFPVIQSAGGVPVGANAAAAGLTPGVPIGPAPVWVVYRR